MIERGFSIQFRAAFVACWLAFASISCGDDVSSIHDRTGSAPIAPWALPQVIGTGGNAAPRTPRSVFFALNGRVDMAHDSKRNLLYVSTSSGEVVRWNMETHAEDGRWTLGGNLGGLDISPDEDTLVVADRMARAVTAPRIYRINLIDESIDTIELPDSGMSTGTLSVAFVDADRVLVASALIGASDLRIVTLADGTSTAVHRVSGQTLLTADPSREVVAYVTRFVLEGTFGSYRVADASWLESKVDVPGVAITAVGGGTQYALATETKVILLGSDLVEQASIKVSSNIPVGLAFNLSGETIYIGWSRVAAAQAPTVEAYDVESQRWIAALENSHYVNMFGTTLYSSGHMRASRDRRFLFVSVDTGVLALQIEP